MKQRIIEWVFILTALIPAVLLAQWNTDLFDGESERWGHGYERAQQCYTAVVERILISEKPYDVRETNTTPRRWGSSWTLKEAKDDIGSMVAEHEWDGWPSGFGWLNMSELGESSIEDWLDTNTAYLAWGSCHLDNCFTWSKDELEAAVGAPTNWFQDDPHWGVVTHSNGWQYLDEIVNPLTNWCTEYSQGIWGETQGIVHVEKMYFYEEGHGTNIADAANNAETNQTYHPMGLWDDDGYCLYNLCTVKGSGTNWHVGRRAAGMRITYKTIPWHSEVDLYATVGEIAEGGTYGWMTWSETQAWHKVETINVGDSDAVFEIGPQDKNDAIPYSEAVLYEPEHRNRGWLMMDYDWYTGALFTVRKFKVTDGFEYVE